MAEKIVERQRIKLNKVEYYLDSLDENSQKILGDIRVIDGEMQKLQVQMSIAGVAKNSLLEKIQENSSEFEKAPIDEKDEDEDEVTESKSAGKTEETENQLKDVKVTGWEDQ